MKNVNNAIKETAPSREEELKAAAKETAPSREEELKAAAIAKLKKDISDLYPGMLSKVEFI